MSFSLNEVEALAKKASKGAGYSWGVAEESGKATRYLCEHGMDGCLALAKCLERMDGVPHSQRAPQLKSDKWTSLGGTLCPLATGTALSDYSTLLETKGLVLENVAEPGLLIYFASLCARRLNSAVSLLWNDTTIVTDGRNLSTEEACLSGVHDVGVIIGGEVNSTTAHHSRAYPDRDAWKILNVLAGRTYAPATDESRQKGAGAGPSDGD